MAGLTRKVHMVSAVDWGSIDRFAPDLQIRVNADNNGSSHPETPRALQFRDPDGETRIYLLDDAGRKALIGQLTGGLVIPGG